MEKNRITKATLGRLPQYLQYLKSLPLSENTNISSTSIARGLNLGEVQVRKDLNSVSGAGKPKIGYNSYNLIKKLEATLGCDELTPAILVGAGKLGRALLDYDGFEEYGVKIIAGFDMNTDVLRHDNSKPILHTCHLESFCRENNIKIGIITVGKGSAQDVCNLMINCGITAIWNFAPCSIETPDNILVKQENMALSLAYLNNRLIK